MKRTPAIDRSVGRRDRFGESGSRLVIEEFLEGEELSLFRDLRRHARASVWFGAGSQGGV